MSDEDKTTLEAIRELQNRARRECAAEIDAALAKHGCALAAVSYVTPDGRIAARVEVIAK